MRFVYTRSKALNFLKALAILIPALCVYLWVSPSAARSPVTYYVSASAPEKSGASTELGAPGNVWETIAGICLTSAQAGDEIVFLDGNYKTSTWHSSNRSSGGFRNPGIVIYNKNCSNADLPIKIKAQNKHKAIVEFDQGALAQMHAIGLFNFTLSSGFVLDGFDIRGNNNPEERTDRGVYINQSNQITISNTRVSHTGSSGIGAGLSTHIRIESNEIFNTAGWGNSCGSGVSFFENDNPESLDADADADGYSNYIIANRIYENENRMSDAKADNCVTEENKTPTDGNCIILDLMNAKHGKLSPYSPKTLVANNICYNNGGKGVQVLGSSNIDVVNNVFYKNNANVRRSVELFAICSTINGQSIPVDNIRFINNIVWGRDGAELIGVWQAWRCTTDNVVFENNSFIGKNLSKKHFNNYKFDVETTSDISKVRNCRSDSNLIGLTESDVEYKGSSDIGSSSFMLLAGESLADTGNCDLVLPITGDFNGDRRRLDFDFDGSSVVDPGAVEISSLKR